MSAPIPTPPKSVAELHGALEQHLERPFSVVTRFFVLDKVARLVGSASEGTTLAALTAQCAVPKQKVGNRLNQVMARGVRSGLLKAERQGGVDHYTLTFNGRRFVSAGAQVRLQLWKVNPRMRAAEVCAIADHEDSRDEALEVVEQESYDPARSEVRQRSARGAKARDTVGALWVGLMTVPRCATA